MSRRLPLALLTLLLAAAMVVVAPSPAGASGAACPNGQWTGPTSSQKFALVSGTISQSTDARRAPSFDGSCDRGFNYSSGQRVEVGAAANGFYFVHRPSDGDYAWIDARHINTGAQATSAPAPSSTPAPSTPAPQSIGLNLAPFVVCDNELQRIATLIGFYDGETVRVTINGRNYDRNADAQGKRTINWRCTGSGSTLTVYVRGLTSGATAQFAIKEVDAAIESFNTAGTTVARKQ